MGEGFHSGQYRARDRVAARTVSRLEVGFVSERFFLTRECVCGVGRRGSERTTVTALASLEGDDLSLSMSVYVARAMRRHGYAYRGMLLACAAHAPSFM
jgi:hypothetical protein